MSTETLRRRSLRSNNVAIRLVYEDRSYVRDPGDTLESDLGILDVPSDVAPGDVIETHLGHAFEVRDLRLPDCFEHFDRSGAPMLPRDVGMIIGLTGVRGGDRILDIGTGTGILAAGMGFAGADVVTYERDASAAETARENVALVDLEDQIDVRTGDGGTAVTEGDLESFDVITLDTGDAPEIASHAGDVLVPGGYLAAYSPFIEQTRGIVEAAREELEDVQAFDTIQRELDVDERGTRPTTMPVGHTGYLTIARRP